MENVYFYTSDLDEITLIRKSLGSSLFALRQGQTFSFGDRKKFFIDKILVCSNYGLLFQDFAFTDVKQLAIHYDKPIIFLWDEVQRIFPASDRVLPTEVRDALSLNRKGHGKMIYWSSQDHELVHKTIRRLTIEFGVTKTIAKRYTRIKWFRKDDYQLLYEQNDINKKMKIHPFKKFSYIQDDYIRTLYNSFGWDNGERLSL